jgi:hypothetical protein
MLSYLSIIGSIIFSLVHLINRLKSIFKYKTNSEINYLELFNYYFTIFAIGSIAAPIAIGVYFSEWQIRYCIFPFYLGIMNIIFFINYLWLDKNKNTIIKYISIVTVSICTIYIIINNNKYKPFSVVSKIGSFYPAVVKATDELSSVIPLKNGIGDYWDAKHISVLSKKNIIVNTVFSNLHGWFHTNNLN